MAYFSDLERRILINQLQLLAMLDRERAAEYERSASLVKEAGQEVDIHGPARQIAMAEVDEPMSFTFRVLSFYSFLQNSFYALDLKEKIRIDRTALVFSGFYPRDEQIYADHMSFIRDHLGQFSLLEMRQTPKPQTPMVPFYKALLALRTDGNDALLDFEGMTGMINMIKELRIPARQNHVEAKASAA